MRKMKSRRFRDRFFSDLTPVRGHSENYDMRQLIITESSAALGQSIKDSGFRERLIVLVGLERGSQRIRNPHPIYKCNLMICCGWLRTLETSTIDRNSVTGVYSSRFACHCKHTPPAVKTKVSHWNDKII